MTLSIAVLSTVLLSFVVMSVTFAECLYAECRNVMMNVVVLIVVAPIHCIILATGVRRLRPKEVRRFRREVRRRAQLRRSRPRLGVSRRLRTGRKTF